MCLGKAYKVRGTGFIYLCASECRGGLIDISVDSVGGYHVWCPPHQPCLLCFHGWRNLQDTLEESVQHYFGGGAAAMNLHERLADLLLMELAFSMEDAGKLTMQPAHI